MDLEQHFEKNCEVLAALSPGRVKNNLIRNYLVDHDLIQSEKKLSIHTLAGQGSAPN